MKNSTKTLIITFIIVFAGAFIRNYFKQSNNNKTEFGELEINSLYSIKVPNYLSKTTQLNEFASYQGYNSEKRRFLIIIDDLKTGLFSLEVYNEMVEDRHKTGYNSLTITNKENIKINKFDAIQFNFVGSTVNGNIYALSTVIEGISDFYQIFAWTSIKENELFFSEMKQTANSFKEIKNSP